MSVSLLLHQNHQHHHLLHAVVRHSFIEENEKGLADLGNRIDSQGNVIRPLVEVTKESVDEDVEIPSVYVSSRLDGAFDTNLYINRARENFAKSYVFWSFLVISSGIAIAEPIVIAYGPDFIEIQFYLLIIATFLMFFGIYMTAFCFENVPGNPILHIPFHEKIFMLIVDGECLIEFVCILVGWVLLFVDSAGAILRCFRIFRFLWYFELTVVENPPDYVPIDHPLSFTKVMVLCTKFLNKISFELFTEHSRGGIVLVAMVLFQTYVVALMCWYNEPNLTATWGGPTPCADLSDCFFIIFRMIAYDGLALDYLTLTADADYPGYTVLLFLYIILCSIVVYNGLIGIFGANFVEEEEEEEDEEEEAEEEKVVADATDSGLLRYDSIAVLSSKDIHILAHKNLELLDEFIDMKKSFEFSIREVRAEIKAVKEKKCATTA